MTPHQVKKTMLLIAAAAVMAACNQDGGKDKTTGSPGKVANVTAPAAEPAANIPPAAPSNELRDKGLCNACDLDCSSHSVEDVYDVVDGNGKKQTLVAFSESVGGPNASYEVDLVTENTCRNLLNPSGTAINFVMMPGSKGFPNVSVSSHLTAEESEDTSYRWNGVEYVTKNSSGAP